MVLFSAGEWLTCHSTTFRESPIDHNGAVKTETSQLIINWQASQGHFFFVQAVFIWQEKSTRLLIVAPSSFPLFRNTSYRPNKGYKKITKAHKFNTKNYNFWNLVQPHTQFLFSGQNRNFFRTSGAIKPTNNNFRTTIRFYCK